MRWRGRRGSGNIVDRRGAGTRLALGGGGAVVVIVLALLFGVDPTALLSAAEEGARPGPSAQVSDAPVDPEALDDDARMISVVLADTEDVWGALFEQSGQRYPEPKLVLFSGRVDSACGMAGAAVGPFYCPSDQQVYLDLSFFDALHRQLGAPGDFARAYVIAHEVGHHVQNLLGVSDAVHTRCRQVSETECNELSVRLELQADFYAGVWAHHADARWRILEEGDVEEALNAASAIGDDRLQRRSQGYVVPDAFTHGTSAQRVRWFRRGLETGDPGQGDTFEADAL